MILLANYRIVEVERDEEMKYIMIKEIQSDRDRYKKQRKTCYHNYYNSNRVRLVSLLLLLDTKQNFDILINLQLFNPIKLLGIPIQYPTVLLTSNLDLRVEY